MSLMKPLGVQLKEVLEGGSLGVTIEEVNEGIQQQIIDRLVFMSIH